MTPPRVHHVVCSLVLWTGSMAVLIRCVAVEAQTSRPEPNFSVGKAVYELRCARCHGIAGQGDGRDAKRLYPKPRNFTEGVYKFRSTASGTPPTDHDLFDIITNGLPGSGMPDWAHLDEAARWQLVDYLKSLSPAFQNTTPQLVSIGKDPGPQHVDPKQGRAVYEKLGCAACHGPQGRANGPSAKGLVDNWGRAIRPANLTQGWNYRGGSEPAAIVTRVLTGIDGSPMPSYAEAASPDDVWQLAYYVRSLQQEPRWAMIVHAASLAGALPESPDDPRWRAAERVEVRLRNVVQPDGEMSGPPSVTTVSWQAVYNSDAISFRVAWDDATEDREDPPDALAIAWRPVGVAGDVITLQTWPLRDSPVLDLCVWSAQNGQAHEALTKSYDPLINAIPAAAGRKSQATYDNGRWTVVVTRPLKPSDIEGASSMSPGRFIPIAFAVRDGGNPGQRAVSTWVDLVLQPAPVSSSKPDRSLVLVWAISGIVLVVGAALALKPR